MNPANPFQISSSYQQELQQTRRKRFKKIVIATVAVAVMMLVGLLIQGCMSEHSKTAAATSPTPQMDQTLSAPRKTASIPQPAVTAAPQLAPAVVKQVIATHSESVYVVKSGDTLSHIAETHGTTVKAIKSANNLADNHVLVGAKLKIPVA